MPDATPAHTHTHTPAPTRHHPARTALALRLLLGAGGVAMLAYGAWGVLHGAHESALESTGRWLLGGLILHDAFLAPAVFTAGFVAYRITTPRLRRTLAAILLIGGSAVLVALPEFLLPPGNTNPTVHPLNYARDLAIVGGSVVAAAALYLLLSARRERRVVRRRALAEARRLAARKPEPEASGQSLQSEEASPPPPGQGPISRPDA